MALSGFCLPRARTLHQVSWMSPGIGRGTAQAFQLSAVFSASERERNMPAPPNAWKFWRM
jgi:hypothetical protein